MTHKHISQNKLFWNVAYGMMWLDQVGGVWGCFKNLNVLIATLKEYNIDLFVIDATTCSVLPSIKNVATHLPLCNDLKWFANDLKNRITYQSWGVGATPLIFTAEITLVLQKQIGEVIGPGHNFLIFLQLTCGTVSKSYSFGICLHSVQLNAAWFLFQM